VTSLINAKGELVQSLPMFVPDVLKTEVDILDGETYYVRYGDWFAWGITIITVAIVLFHLKRAITDK
jgi:apolipoprotein N-acyltransferase